ncbi:ABC transporter permease [Mesorhizobium sp. YR577]|uniref:ABC transporter permease n=1 Tax=Mesorhizobium sp. YR577 TaxID=1884373 RepID=UPI000B84A4C5|nr:ABC transporter permease [Mesorhizobium sp. YR577]
MSIPAMAESEDRSNRPRIRVYRPDSRFADKTASAVVHLLSEVWRHRAHVAMTFKRDFKAAYRGTTLGVFWNFALPLLPVSVYVFLSVSGVVPAVDGLPRAVYVTFNVTLWLLFAGLIEQPITVVKSRNSDAMKTSLPISVAIASSFASLAFETFLRALLVVAVILLFLTPMSALAPLALFVIALGAIFSLSVGLLCAILNIVVPDTQSVVIVVMRYGIFLSGVIFPLSAIGPLRWLERVNPLAILIHAARDLTFVGTLTHPLPLVALCGLTLLLALFAARVFYLMEYRIRGVI